MLDNHLTALYKELGMNISPEKGKDKSYPIELSASAKMFVTELFPGMRFSASLGPLPEEEQEEHLIKYMRANFIGQGTGESRLGLDAAGKHVTLTMYNPDDVSYSRFKESVEEFANFVDYWKGELWRAF